MIKMRCRRHMNAVEEWVCVGSDRGQHGAE